MSTLASNADMLIRAKLRLADLLQLAREQGNREASYCLVSAIKHADRSEWEHVEWWVEHAVIELGGEPAQAILRKHTGD